MVIRQSKMAGESAVYLQTTCLFERVGKWFLSVGHHRSSKWLQYFIVLLPIIRRQYAQPHPILISLHLNNLYIKLNNLVFIKVPNCKGIGYKIKTSSFTHTTTMLIKRDTRVNNTFK